MKVECMQSGEMLKSYRTPIAKATYQTISDVEARAWGANRIDTLVVHAETMITRCRRHSRWLAAIQLSPGEYVPARMKLKR